MLNNIHGIDHVGLTVPSIEEATIFFQKAFNAVVLYDGLKNNGVGRADASTQHRLGVASDMREMAIRMIALPNGPSLELFEFNGPSQRQAITPADIGWTHIGIYVDDVFAAVERIEAAGGHANAKPIPLSGLEQGNNNYFCYTQTPWGSTLEVLSYPSRQPYLDQAPRRKWRV